jgi:hypothetical protein
MKKIFSLSLSLVAALMLAMWSSQAGAITLGNYDTGALVPVVIHNGANVNTLIGITLASDGTTYTSTAPAQVCWAFYNVNSIHITDGCFPMTSNDMYAFSWMDQAGVGLANTEGYIAFATTATGAKISANAFLVDSTAHDAIYVPVLPLDSGDMTGIGTTAFEVVSAVNGSTPGNKVDVRYWIDPAYQATTAVKLWSVCDVSYGQWNITTSPGATYPLIIYNTDEAKKSLNIYLKNAELNTIDPSTLQGRPTNFVDGFIRFAIPAPTGDVNPDGSAGTCGTNNMVIFSYVDSSLIGAAQTMLAGEGPAALLP